MIFKYRKYLIFLFVFIFNTLFGKNLDVNFQYFSYLNQDGIPYIDTYLNFLSSSINYKKVDEYKFQGSILVEMKIKVDQNIIYYDKYLFMTPILQDTLIQKFFLDKQMIPLPNNNYVIEFLITDNNRKSNSISATTDLSIKLKHESPSFSDLMLLDSYEKSIDNGVLTKSGYDLIPKISQGDHFYDQNDSLLNFYIEWYNFNKNSFFNNGYLINYYINNDQKKFPVKSFNVVKKKKSNDPKAEIGGFDISTLPSGNYYLNVCLLNREAKIVDIKKIFFQRKNNKHRISPNDYNKLESRGSFVDDFTNIEELAEYISCLFPIANQIEWTFANNQLELWEIDKMRQFFYGFWLNRDPLHPKDAWLSYYKRVSEVNTMFSTSKKKGFATDRGYTVLKYGNASFIDYFNRESQGLPYQIWRYNEINNQANREFIFVEIIRGSNEYELIHSSVRGELFNPNWRNIVNRNN